VAKVKIRKSTPSIYVAPNPVTDNIIYLQMNNLPEGVYKVRLLNNLGQVILRNLISHAPGTATEAIRPQNKLVPGIYQVEVIAPAKEVHKLKVIVN